MPKRVYSGSIRVYSKNCVKLYFQEWLPLLVKKFAIQFLIQYLSTSNIYKQWYKSHISQTAVTNNAKMKKDEGGRQKAERENAESGKGKGTAFCILHSTFLLSSRNSVLGRVSTPLNSRYSVLGTFTSVLIRKIHFWRH